MDTLSLRKILYYTFRIVHTIVNNIMAIPAYTVWLILLKPLLFYDPKLYWMLESILFKALLSFVVMWTNTGGYKCKFQQLHMYKRIKVIESGDDLSSLYDQHALLLANHQSTADTPIMMSLLLPKSLAIGQVMWIMDYVFIYTNFGWAAYLHGDFFIQQGKEYRYSELDRLKEHLLNSYVKTNKKWIVLFPEGGFLRKRRAGSQKFAMKNNLPVLDHVTLPRVGAMNTIIDTVGHTSQQNGIKDGTDQHRVKWVIDVTIGYPKCEAMNIHGICIGYWAPRNIAVHYRAYPLSDIPLDQDGRTKWLYERYTEKEEMLDNFYKHNTFLDETDKTERTLPRMKRQEVPFDWVWFLISYGFYAVSAYVFWLYIYCPIWRVFLYLLSFVF